VTLSDGLGGRKDVLLGLYQPKDKQPHTGSRARYDEVIGEWLANGRTFRRPGDAETAELTVNELLVRFMEFAEKHYRHADGRSTSELRDFRFTLKPLKLLYGSTSAAQFGPLALRAVRQRMIDSGLCRPVINQRVGRIRRVFKWAIGLELVPPSVLHGLQAVGPLQRGRTGAREPEPVKPVPEPFIDAVLPFVLPPVRAMIELMRLTGMRPGEVSGMRMADIDTFGPVWLFRPPVHKTAWRGRQRVIALGPRSQVIVRGQMTTRTEDYLFSPKRAMEDRSAKLRARRRNPVQPSQQYERRRARKRRRAPADRYTPHSLLVAVRRGCLKANVPTWRPSALRHNRATDIRRQFGLEAASVCLGHSDATLTGQVYAERDLSVAVRIAAEVG
jgi:integrase